MGIGIIDFGTYIPYYRVSRAAIGAAWKMEQAAPLLLTERLQLTVNGGRTHLPQERPRFVV